ncbi:MAG: SUMF1/EgtB/PvdO family nonheme iron enzyme, partial [Lentisphaerae bacterium]|nr:SUMF1/EgtB/PvdO family nonheme iron enzyme [Lentisphaerota bacterium]
MRRIFGLAVVAVVVPFVAALLVTAAEVRVLDFQSDGTLSWTNDFTEVAPFHILETIDLMGDWSTNGSGTQNPGELTVTNVPVTETQKFYRVSAESNAPSGIDPALYKAVDLDTNWTGGGDAHWFYTNPPAPTHDGADSLQSGAIGHNQETWFGADFEGPGDLMFWWKVSCETDPDTDYLGFFLDGGEEARIFGDTDWTNQVISLGPGSHAAVWNYMRDGIVGGGDNAGWVDEITFSNRTILILEGESIDVTMDEDGVPTPFDLELHAYVAGGDADWSIYTQGLHGVANTNGGSATNQVIVYSPDADYEGLDSFIVEVNDGLVFDRITVNVTIVGQNDAPVITGGENVTVVMDEDGDPTDFQLTLGAVDPDTPGESLLWTISRQPTSGVASVTDAHGTSEEILYAQVTNVRTHWVSWDIYTVTNVSMLDTNALVTDGVFLYDPWVPFFTNMVTNSAWYDDVYFFEYLDTVVETNGVEETNYIFDMYVYEYVYEAVDTNLTFEVKVSDGVSNATTTVKLHINSRNDAPSNVLPPSVIGLANVGQVLSVGPGTWFDLDNAHFTNAVYDGQVYPLYNFVTNLARLYQWQVSAFAGGPWSAVVGETNPTYQVRGADIGGYVRVTEAVADHGEPEPWQLTTEYTNSPLLGPMGPPTPEHWPTGMVYLAGRWQEMGFTTGGDAPNRTNYVSGFYIETHEVSGGLWQEVYDWATNGHGYSDLTTNGWAGVSYDGTNVTEEGSSDHPVVNVTFYECVKWCNARSEKEGLTPAYYTDGTKTTVLRTGMPGASDSVKWGEAAGYRLPTEAEWETAARGGLPVTNLYPWGSGIDGTKANYRASGDPFDEGTTPTEYYST